MLSPNMNQGNYVSRAKLQELQEELHRLKTVRRKEIAESLEYAKSLGDLSENAEYNEARDAQARLEDRIMELENLLKSAVIVEEHHSNIVEVGTTVSVRKEGDKADTTYNIVGSAEANFKENKISNESPIGKALLGKKKGEVALVKTPRGEVRYTVIELK